jgi:hypothetical protein
MALKLTSLTIGVSPLTADVVCVTAIRKSQPVRQVAGVIVDRVISAYFSMSSQARSKFSETPSTLAWILGATKSTCRNSERSW